MQESGKRVRFFLFAAVFGFSIIIVLFFVSSNLIAEANDLVTQKQIHIFLEAFEFVQSTFVDEDKIDSKTLIQGALKGMMEALDDPYSVYLSETDMEEMEETTVGKFGGVGLYILDVDEGIEVARPIAGTPAFREGITAGDIIIGVDDESVVDLDIDQVIDRLKGEPGTDVKITVLRGKTRTLDFTVTRAIIEIPTVSKAMITDDIAYLKINQFTPLTYDQVRDALDEFNTAEYESLVIDLRSNPGGLLPSVVDVADLFFTFGKLIVYTESRVEEENQIFKARRSRVVPKEIKIVVLIDKYSASASEILAGVLKDHDRATIIGEKSYGKGSVQQIHYIGDGAGLKITTSKYFTPSGNIIHEVGIEPDIEIIDEEWTDAEKEALNALYESDKIIRFVESNKKITDNKTEEFIQELHKEGILLRERYIKRLIRNELNRTNNDPPVFDLDYDIVLQKAVEVLGR